MQYHFSGSKREGVVVECGPVLSFLADGDYHYYDADPWHPIDGKEEYKKFDLGIRPAVYYETRHWRFGVQAYIGLLDTKRKYPPYVTDRYTPLCRGHSQFPLVKNELYQVAVYFVQIAFLR